MHTEVADRIANVPPLNEIVRDTETGRADGGEADAPSEDAPPSTEAPPPAEAPPQAPPGDENKEDPVKRAREGWRRRTAENTTVGEVRCLADLARCAKWRLDDKLLFRTFCRFVGGGEQRLGRFGVTRFCELFSLTLPFTLVHIAAHGHLFLCA